MISCKKTKVTVTLCTMMMKKMTPPSGLIDRPRVVYTMVPAPDDSAFPDVREFPRAHRTDVSNKDGLVPQDRAI